MAALGATPRKMCASAHLWRVRLPSAILQQGRKEHTPESSIRRFLFFEGTIAVFCASKQEESIPTAPGQYDRNTAEVSQRAATAGKNAFDVMEFTKLVQENLSCVEEESEEECFAAKAIHQYHAVDQIPHWLHMAS